MMEILLKTSEITRIPAEWLLGRSRRRQISVARQIAMYAMCKKGYSTPEIGRFFGRHHTTVVHGRKTIEGLIDTDPAVAAQVDEVMSRPTAKAA